MNEKNKGYETLSNLLLAAALVAAIFLNQYDWLLYVIIALLIVSMVFSALLYKQLPGKTEKKQYLVRKLIILATGGVVMIIASLV